MTSTKDLSEKIIIRYEIVIKTEKIFDDESEYSYETLDLPYRHNTDVHQIVHDYFNNCDDDLIDVVSAKILPTN